MYNAMAINAFKTPTMNSSQLEPLHILLKEFGVVAYLLVSFIMSFMIIGVEKNSKSVMKVGITLYIKVGPLVGPENGIGIGS